MGFIGFHTIFSDFTRSQRKSLDFIGPHRISLGFIGFNKIS